MYNDRFQSYPDYLVEEDEYRWLFCMVPFPPRESHPPDTNCLLCGAEKQSAMQRVYVQTAPALPYKMNSSEERLAHSNKGDNKKPRCYFFNYTSWFSIRF
jgi:hypothetical protein